LYIKVLLVFGKYLDGMLQGPVYSLTYTVYINRL
jgi:hypothetical protein